MKKTEYLVLEGDDVAEKAFSDGEKIEMFYSEGEVWNNHMRGRKIGHIKDDGNGVEIKI